jgi:hypothetical protein
LLLLITVNSLSIPYYLWNPFGEALKKGTEIRNSLPSYMEELVKFFNELGDDGAVIGYQKYFLITFSNRKVVELSKVYGFRIFKNIFENANLNDTISGLKVKNIKYIIIPTNTETVEYAVFNKYKERFPMFAELLNSNHVVLYKTLINYKVYKVLLSTEEYEDLNSKVEKLRNEYNTPKPESGRKQKIM